MQLDHIAVRHRMLAPDLLSVEPSLTPDARIADCGPRVFADDDHDELTRRAPGP